LANIADTLQKNTSSLISDHRKSQKGGARMLVFKTRKTANNERKPTLRFEWIFLCIHAATHCSQVLVCVNIYLLFLLFFLAYLRRVPKV
jgi:hypothetical protein